MSVRFTRARISLIEIVICIVLITAVTAIVATNLHGVWQDSRVRTTELSMLKVEQDLDYYAATKGGRYPTVEQGLSAVADPLRGTVPRDGWNHDLSYDTPGETHPHPYDLESFGSDGERGGDGYAADLLNWDVGR
jgi:general secretion pathway protein G